MPELELAVLFHPAQAQLMLERLVQPHFGMSLSDIVVDPSGEVFDIFRRPSPDESGPVCFFPQQMPVPGGYGAVFFQSGPISGQKDPLKHGTVFEGRSHGIDRNNVVVQFFRQYGSIRNDIEIFRF